MVRRYFTGMAPYHCGGYFVVFAFGLDTFGRRKSGVSVIVYDRVVCVDVGAPSGCYNVYANSGEITSTTAVLQGHGVHVASESARVGLRGRARGLHTASAQSLRGGCLLPMINIILCPSPFANWMFFLDLSSSRRTSFSFLIFLLFDLTAH